MRTCNGRGATLLPVLRAHVRREVVPPHARQANTINDRLLMRLQDAAGHLSRNENRAVIGALAGMEAEVERMRTFMVLIRDHFQTENSREEL